MGDQPAPSFTTTCLTEVDDHPTSMGMSGQYVFHLSCYSWCTKLHYSQPIVAPQFPLVAGLAPLPYTGRNFMRKFLPP